MHGVERTSDSMAIVGRCFVGPLRLGDVFVRHTLPDGGDESAVRLTITRIEAYGHTLNECDEVKLPRFRGHPSKRDTARGVSHGKAEEKDVHS